MKRDVGRAIVAAAAVAAVTAVYVRGLNVTNATTVALSYLLVVLVVAATSRLWVAVTTSVVAMFCINFFFLYQALFDTPKTTLTGKPRAEFSSVLKICM